MRELTDNERELRERRLAGFEAFFSESMPVLVDLMTRLELPEPHLVLINADPFVDPLDTWIRRQLIPAADRGWVLARLGYFIGEWLNQEHNGCWYLNELPDSRFFLRYVVGQFTKIANTAAMIDPIQAADTYLTELPHSSLRGILGEMTSELRNC